VIAVGVLEPDFDFDLAGGVQCAVREPAVLARMAGSGTTDRCKAGVEIVEIAQAVVLEVGRGLAVETLMQQAAVVLSLAAVPEQPASSGEKWLSVRSVMLVTPTRVVMSHPASAHYECHSDQAADSLQVVEASALGAATS
jgi:hypothetical protein